MVNSQLRTGDIVDREVLAAFLETPRERFVAPDFVALAYLDREVPARGAKVRQLLPPSDSRADASGRRGQGRR